MQSVPIFTGVHVRVEYAGGYNALAGSFSTVRSLHTDPGIGVSAASPLVTPAARTMQLSR